VPKCDCPISIFLCTHCDILLNKNPIFATCSVLQVTLIVQQNDSLKMTVAAPFKQLKNGRENQLWIFFAKQEQQVLKKQLALGCLKTDDLLMT